MHIIDVKALFQDLVNRGSISSLNRPLNVMELLVLYKLSFFLVYKVSSPSITFDCHRFTFSTSMYFIINCLFISLDATLVVIGRWSGTSLLSLSYQELCYILLKSDISSIPIKFLHYFIKLIGRRARFHPPHNIHDLLGRDIYSLHPNSVLLSIFSFILRAALNNSMTPPHSFNTGITQLEGDALNIFITKVAPALKLKRVRKSELALRSIPLGYPLNYVKK